MNNWLSAIAGKGAPELQQHANIFSSPEFSSRFVNPVVAASFRRIAAVTALFSFVFVAAAHDPGLSTATVRLLGAKVEAILTFALKDVEQLVPLDVNQNGLVTQAELFQNETTLEKLATENFIVKFDGQPAKPDDVRCELDKNNNVDFYLGFPYGRFSRIEIQSKFIASLPPGHRQYFLLQDLDGKQLAERLLSASSDSVTIQLDAAGSNASAKNVANSFLNFLELGVKHILTGYDHLLFLFALLLVTRNFVAALKIITCFTLAHSITLAIATFNFVQLPGRLVEPLIAASIVYVGLENIIRRGDPQSRWLLTFAFGLIHGFGFASVLRELGVGAGDEGVIMPLFSFNLGVELGQIAVAAALLPFVWKLGTKPVFAQRWVPACSVVVALAGGWWFVQRVWFET